MDYDSAESNNFLTQLAAAPERIQAMVADHDDALLKQKPDKKSWSVNDVLAHIRACADVWGEGIDAMLTQEHPRLDYVHPRTHARQVKYHKLPFSDSFQAFTDHRNDLVARLQSLDDADWSRAATFVKKVTARDDTVYGYVRRIALHEAQHLDQIATIIAVVSSRTQ